MIQVSSVSKAFGKRKVLDGIAFEVADGEVVTLVAGNGAGKTTCFRAVAGLVAPDRGSVSVDGRVQTAGSRRVPVAFASDTRIVWGGRTPRSVLADYAALSGVPRGDAGARIDAIAARLDMTAQLDVVADKPSTGEAMKVTLARILVSGLRNVILDEPTSGLDFATAATMERILRELRDAGCAVLLSSHRVEEIERVSDRVVLLSGGRIAADATPSALAAASPDGTMATELMRRSRETWA